jgi:DNA-binding transcriptional MerR regulator
MTNLTRAAFARQLKIGRSTLYRLERAGVIPSAERASGNRSYFSPAAQAIVRNLVEASR